MASLFGYSLSLLLVIAGVALCVMEALAPGAHLIVLGVALLFAGLVGLALGGPGGVLPSVAEPLALAAMVLAFGAIALYGYRTFDIAGSEAGRTSDSDDLTGREGRVTERVTRSSGQVRLHSGGFDPTFSARSVDGEIPEGTQVIVVDPGGGSVLTVESVEGGLDDIDRELARERSTGTSAGDGTTGERGEAGESDRESEPESERESEPESERESEPESERE